MNKHTPAELIVAAPETDEVDGTAIDQTDMSVHGLFATARGIAGKILKTIGDITLGERASTPRFFDFGTAGENYGPRTIEDRK